MAIYLISDTHFGSELFCPEFTKDADKRTGKILKKLKNTDILIHLGDICNDDDKYFHDKYIKPLKCKKWLVRGNNDNQSTSWYLSNGWDFVADTISFKIFCHNIIFSHKPIKLHDNSINVHGHFHNYTRDEYYDEFRDILTNRHILVCAKLFDIIMHLEGIMEKCGGEKNHNPFCWIYGRGY